MNQGNKGGLEPDAFELKRMMRQQAHEKAFEIQVVAQRTFENEKDKIVKQGFEKLQTDHDAKLSKLTMNSKIEQSKKINESRLRCMNERNKCVEKIKKAAKERLMK